MTSIMHLVVDNYNELINNKKDPLVDSWLFMQSPIPICTIIVIYLFFVLKWGPAFMKNREPFKLKGLLIAYNLYNVIFSTWLITVPFRTQFINIFHYGCTVELPSELKPVFSCSAWWYFFSKVVELLDTVFFVLRKKNSQITFLHIYHHTMMAFFSWVYLKFLPGEQGIFIGFLNSFVHVIMYTYYFIAALGPQYQKYLWWKKYMTWIQLTQFVLMLVYLLSTMAMDCKTPRVLTFFLGGNIIIFIYLFSDFYRKAYNKKNQMAMELNENNVKYNKKNGVLLNNKNEHANKVK